MGTGRVATGAAVTGHGKSKVRAGEGSMHPTRSGLRGRLVEQRKGLKSGSFLAGIADRARRFEQS
jgi:mediator of replication checkpoint protein 1